MATIKYILSRVGERPAVTLRLTISSQHKIQARVPGVLAFREWWSEKKQTHASKFINPLFAPEVSQVNTTLRTLSAQVLQRFAASDISDIDKDWLTSTIDDILYPDKSAAKPETLMAVYGSFVDGAERRIMPRTGRPVSKKTASQYKQTQHILENYLSMSRQRSIGLSELDKSFYDSFVSYMYSVGLQPNTVGKHIKHVKAAINLLPLEQRVQCEFVTPGKCVRITEESENIYLTEAELGKILNCECSSPHLNRVRDEFVLLAWTGCRYSDLDKLTQENVVTLDGGGQYFKLRQQKTGNSVTIPILPAARVVLDRHGWQMPAPISNQKFNAYIKDVCKEAGLTDTVVLHRTNPKTLRRVAHRYKKYECVTAHTARRTFATNMYKRDFPTLMIMAITGHKTEKAFLTYIKVSEDENARRMMERFMSQEKSRIADEKQDAAAPQPSRPHESTADGHTP